MDSGVRGMTPVAMTIINPLEKCWQSQGSNKQPPVLKSCMLLRAKGESHYYRGQGSNSQPPTHEADALTTKPSQRFRQMDRQIPVSGYAYQTND